MSTTQRQILELTLNATIHGMLIKPGEKGEQNLESANEPFKFSMVLIMDQLSSLKFQKSQRNTQWCAYRDKKKIIIILEYLIEEALNSQKIISQENSRLEAFSPAYKRHVCTSSDEGFCFSLGIFRTFSNQHAQFWLWLDHQVSPLKQDVRKTVKWQGYEEGNEQKTAGSTKKTFFFCVFLVETFNSS